MVTCCLIALALFFQTQAFILPTTCKTSRKCAAVALSSEPSPSELQEILQVAVKASARAADIIRQHSGGSAVVELKSTSRDLLTVVDPLCEEAVRETIAKNYPDHVILGEEGVPPGKQSAIDALENALESSTKENTFLWIVDPIDGTTNFASGIPLSAPSVAVVYQEKIVVGVIHDPHRDEVWTAVKGQGTQLNGETVVVDNASAKELGEAVIGCESPAGQESLEVALRGIPVLMPKCRTLRLLGSTAIMMPWVAIGRLSAYWSPDECAWDHGAGALIVQEAGGIVSDLDGSDFTIRTRKLLASQNKHLHREILRLLKDEAGIE